MTKESDRLQVDHSMRCHYLVVCCMSASKSGANVELMTQSALKRKFPWLFVDDVELASYGQSNINCIRYLNHTSIVVVLFQQALPISVQSLLTGVASDSG